VITIRRQSPLTGEINVMELDVTYEQLLEWRRGGLIQRVMPNLTADQREFLVTGTYPGEWDPMLRKMGLTEE
jgi:Na+-transporting NADH:ubiquinone oxidoreductase subunit NqrF